MKAEKKAEKSRPFQMNLGTSFLGLNTEYEKSDIVIFGVPFDGTTSYRPGARFGPSAIRTESYALESYSPYLNRDVFDYKVCDLGDLDLPFGNTERVLQMVFEVQSKILKDRKFPIMIGGEHLITYPAVQAMAEQYSDLRIIHLDAHTDLRDEYLGEKLSHATVMRRCWEVVGDRRIFQFGIRSGDRPEFRWAKNHTFMCRHGFSALPSALDEIGDAPVYITCDLDILDPACFPGTGTPEAGGVSFIDLYGAFRSMRKLNVVGLDLNELAPNLDPSSMSTLLAGKLLRETIVMIGRKSEDKD
jgi:agmatinase